MLYKNIVYTEIHAEHINTPCWEERGIREC